MVSPRACPGNSWAGVVAETATPYAGEGGGPGALTRVVATPPAGPFPPGYRRRRRERLRSAPVTRSRSRTMTAPMIEPMMPVVWNELTDTVWYSTRFSTKPPTKEPTIKDDGAQDADGVGTGDEQARDQASDETDDNQNDNESDHGRLIPKYGLICAEPRLWASLQVSGNLRSVRGWRGRTATPGAVLRLLWFWLCASLPAIDVFWMAPSSSGPGRRPLKAVTPVRLRSGLPLEAVRRRRVASALCSTLNQPRRAVIHRAGPRPGSAGAPGLESAGHMPYESVPGDDEDGGVRSSSPRTLTLRTRPVRPSCT